MRRVKNTSSLSGVIIVNKEAGISSQAVVNRVKRIFGVSKAGHTGTLDPMATGVLPVLVGRAVKASEFMLTADKHYRAILRLGVVTDTEDTTGTILSESEDIPTPDKVFSVARSFVGELMQVPPMYSAIKQGGKKLYELAREGKVSPREPRKITVYSLDVERIDERNYALTVHCSKGTYIRTLCADIGAALGCGGAMAALSRTCASGYGMELAHTLTELENMSEEERISLVLPTEEIFKKLPDVRLPAFFARLARSGQQIYLFKIGYKLDVGTRVRLYDDTGSFFAVGEVEMFEDGAAIKPIRQF